MVKWFCEILIKMVKGRSIGQHKIPTLWKRMVYSTCATHDDDISEGPSDRSPPQSVPTGKIECSENSIDPCISYRLIKYC